LRFALRPIAGAGGRGVWAALSSFAFAYLLLFQMMKKMIEESAARSSSADPARPPTTSNIVRKSRCVRTFERQVTKRNVDGSSAGTKRRCLLCCCHHV
jgi:hypothetical protein